MASAGEVKEFRNHGKQDQIYSLSHGVFFVGHLGHISRKKKTQLIERVFFPSILSMSIDQLDQDSRDSQVMVRVDGCLFKRGSRDTSSRRLLRKYHSNSQDRRLAEELVEYKLAEEEVVAAGSLVGSPAEDIPVGSPAEGSRTAEVEEGLEEGTFQHVRDDSGSH